MLTATFDHDTSAEIDHLCGENRQLKETLDFINREAKERGDYYQYLVRTALSQPGTFAHPYLEEFRKDYGDRFVGNDVSGLSGPNGDLEPRGASRVFVCFTHLLSPPKIRSGMRFMEMRRMIRSWSLKYKYGY